MMSCVSLQPQEHEFKAGGNMHSPEKQGVLLKQGHGTFGSKAFKERSASASL